MNDTELRISTFGKWMALTAALLGWLFDGLEMGLFPLVASPSLIELGVDRADVIKWLGVITALFLNLCAIYYGVARWLFLRDTGRKLLHLDRQLATRDSALDDVRSYLKQ